MKPRVLFVDHAGVLGGAELYLLDVVKAMKACAHVVLFEDGPFLDRLQKEGVSASVLAASDAVMGVERTGGRWEDVKALPGILKLVVQLRQIAREYDVLFANSQKALVVGALAGRAAGRPVIWNLHDILTADHFSSSHRKIGVFLANQLVDHVIVNSRATQEAFKESGGQDEKTSVIYNGIDVGPFDAIDDTEVSELRAALGLDQCTVVGVFSRLTPWKGQHILLETLGQLTNVHALLVGGPLFQDDEAYERSLRNLAEQMGIIDRVHFLGFREDVPRLMKAVDVVLHSSTSPEPFGRVIVEGMLAHKPVIATDAGGATEIIENGVNGLLIAPNNPMAMTSAINDLLSKPEEAARIATNGYQMARKRFSMENVVQEVINQIRTVAGESDVPSCTETSTPAA